MAPKEQPKRGGKCRGRGRGRGSGAPIQEQMGILVQDLLEDEDYDRYIEKFLSKKHVSPQFYCSLKDIARMGFGFDELLAFQKLDKFVGLKERYDESQVKAFYCIAQRQDGVSIDCQFKNALVSLNPEKWSSLVGLDCDGVDVEASDTFKSYNKEEFIKSVSKVALGSIEMCYRNFSPLQLKCADRMLHWVVVKVIMCKQHNYGRIDDKDLSIMWLLKNKIKVNWPLFFTHRMITYKVDARKKLPYPSFIASVLRSDKVYSVENLLTTPSVVSGLDEQAVQKMHYVKDSNGFWYYDDKLDPGTWYYDFVVVASGTPPNIVKQMKLNMENEDLNLENDENMEDADEEDSEATNEDESRDEDDDDDIDYNPENDHEERNVGVGQSVNLSVVMDSLKDLKTFMNQRFDAQDVQVQELHQRMDNQEASIQDLKNMYQKWDNTSFSPATYLASPFPNQNETYTVPSTMNESDA